MSRLEDIPFGRLGEPQGPTTVAVANRSSLLEDKASGSRIGAESNTTVRMGMVF